MSLKSRLRRMGYEVTCNRAPDGWWCSQEGGHEGPCSARPSWWNVRGMWFMWQTMKWR